MSTNNHRRGVFGAFVRLVAVTLGAIVGGALLYNKHHNPEQHEATVKAASNAKEAVTKKADAIKGKVADKLPAKAKQATDVNLHPYYTAMADTAQMVQQVR